MTGNICILSNNKATCHRRAFWFSNLFQRDRRCHAHLKRQEAAHHELLPLRTDVALQCVAFAITGLRRRFGHRRAVDLREPYSKQQMYWKQGTD